MPLHIHLSQEIKFRKRSSFAIRKVLSEGGLHSILSYHHNAVGISAATYWAGGYEISTAPRSS